MAPSPLPLPPHENTGLPRRGGSFPARPADPPHVSGGGDLFSRSTDTPSPPVRLSRPARLSPPAFPAGRFLFPSKLTPGFPRGDSSFPGHLSETPNFPHTGSFPATPSESHSSPRAGPPPRWPRPSPLACRVLLRLAGRPQRPPATTQRTSRPWLLPAAQRKLPAGFRWASAPAGSLQCRSGTTTTRSACSRRETPRHPRLRPRARTAKTTRPSRPALPCGLTRTSARIRRQGVYRFHHLVGDQPAGPGGLLVLVALERERLPHPVSEPGAGTEAARPGGSTRSVPIMATGITGSPDARASQPFWGRGPGVQPAVWRPCSLRRC